jgi:DNA-binding response OmpR family regulator
LLRFRRVSNLNQAPTKGAELMNRILLIDRDRTLGASLGMACLERGIAIRMAETFCEGVRYLMDAPVTAVLVDGAALRAAGPDRGRVFEAAAPGVPVVVVADRGTPVEEQVKFELQGFRVLVKPFAPEEVLDKIEWAEKAPVSGPDAAAQVRAICG